jgi:hypothetical protein
MLRSQLALLPQVCSSPSLVTTYWQDMLQRYRESRRPGVIARIGFRQRSRHVREQSCV